MGWIEKILNTYSVLFNKDLSKITKIEDEGVTQDSSPKIKTLREIKIGDFLFVDEKVFGRNFSNEMYRSYGEFMLGIGDPKMYCIVLDNLVVFSPIIETKSLIKSMGFEPFIDSLKNEMYSKGLPGGRASLVIFGRCGFLNSCGLTDHPSDFLHKDITSTTMDRFRLTMSGYFDSLYELSAELCFAKTKEEEFAVKERAVLEQIIPEVSIKRLETPQNDECKPIKRKVVRL